MLKIASSDANCCNPQVKPRHVSANCRPKSLHPLDLEWRIGDLNP